MSGLIEKTSKYEPVNLPDQTIEQALVPTATNVDWNDLQRSWLDFKRKVRWQSFFHGREITLTEHEVNLLEAPYKKPVKEPPPSKILAIEVFLSHVETELFDLKNERRVTDNLTLTERKALKKFRTTPVSERNLIVHIQDKSNNFVFLDKDRDCCRVREQIERASFKMLEQDISVETCSERAPNRSYPASLERLEFKV